MLDELKNILENAISYSYKVACIIEDEDSKIYKGVTIQNACLRDMISSEQGAIANYLINSKTKVTTFIQFLKQFLRVAKLNCAIKPPKI